MKSRVKATFNVYNVHLQTEIKPCRIMFFLLYMVSSCFLTVQMFKITAWCNTRSEIDYQGINNDELSFCKGEILVVIDTCLEKFFGTKWNARMLVDGEIVEGYIPAIRWMFFVTKKQYWTKSLVYCFT